MRRLYPIASVLVLATLAGSSWTKAQDKEQARETLNGRGAVVRLYVGWKADPKAYTTLTVALDGLDVLFDAVEQAAGESVPEDAAVVVVPDDQQDSLIAEVMDGCLFGEPYSPGGRITLWPGVVPWVQLNPCLFKDALDQPIPNAEVEILLSDDPRFYGADCQLWIANARIDENGRMWSPKASASCKLFSFLFTVIHPDCGPVPALSHYSSSQPGGDHLLTVGALPKDQWCVFLDALGNPLPGADVKLFRGWVWKSTSELLGQASPLDESGRLCPPPWCPLLDDCCLVVSDPNYGTAIVEPYDKMFPAIQPPLTTCVVPLVSRESDANERSLRGTVIDDSGAPVVGAVVTCGRVTVPGGTRLRAFFGGSYLSGKCAKALTDKQGQFVMHLPLANSDGTLGRMVPLDATYEVGIEAPEDSGLEPFYGLLPAGQEHTITMATISPGPKSFTGVLLFQDEDGIVNDPAKLGQITLTIHVTLADGHWREHTYSNGSWTQQEELPFGTYCATGEWDGILHVFGPVEVTADSPERVVLTVSEIRSAETTYSGRVIHGVTGQPISQALVMQRPWPSQIAAELSDERFMQVFYFGPEAAANGELLQFLEEDIGWRITRTDNDGHFEIALPTSQQDNPETSIVAIRENFLGSELQSRFLQAQTDDTATVLLPDMKLFPAGIVVLDPCVPEPEVLSVENQVRFLYATPADDPRSWVADLWATPVANQGVSVFRRYDLPINRLQSVYVPADVTLTLTIGRRVEQSAPVVMEGVRLEQGEVLDLGSVQFPQAIQVVVQAIDSAGKPLEGIAIRCLPDGLDTANRTAVTDIEGCAHVYVPPHSQGRLVAEYYDEETQTTIREGIAYRVAGEEDGGKEFVLQLSDEFLDGLVASK